MIWVLAILCIGLVGLVIFMVFYIRWISGVLSDTIEGIFVVKDTLISYDKFIEMVKGDDMFKFHGHQKIIQDLQGSTNEVLFSLTALNEVIDDLEEAGVIEGYQDRKLDRKKLADRQFEVDQGLNFAEEEI